MGEEWEAGQPGACKPSEDIAFIGEGEPGVSAGQWSWAPPGPQDCTEAGPFQVAGARHRPQTIMLCVIWGRTWGCICDHTQSVTSEMPTAPMQLPKRCVLLVVGRQR